MVSVCFSENFSSSLQETDQSSAWATTPQVDSLKINFFLGKDNKVYVELSGNLPFVSHERFIHRRMSLSDLMGYSDQQYDDVTAAVQSTLRANPARDPAQSADIDDPRAQLESRMTPSKPECFHMVPHLLSPETALQCKDEDSIEKTFDLDHRGGFIVYKLSSTGGWSLLHALAAALTIRHPSFQFSVLDLYYYYKKAVEDEPVNRMSSAGFLAPVHPAADSCTFDWDITAQAMDSYMEYHGFGPYTFIPVQPPSHKTNPPSCVFTFPCALKDRAVAQMKRVWIVYTANEDQARPQFNVVLKHDTKLSPHLVNSVNELESQQSVEYRNNIRFLEADLMDRNVSMTSLALEEIQELFHETEAARQKHMSRPCFGSKAIEPNRRSQRPNGRKRVLMISTPPPLSLLNPETGHSRSKYRSSSPMSHISIDFPYEMMDTGSWFASQYLNSGKASETVAGEKNRVDDDYSGLDPDDDHKIMSDSSIVLSPGSKALDATTICFPSRFRTP